MYSVKYTVPTAGFSLYLLGFCPRSCCCWTIEEICICWYLGRLLDTGTQVLLTWVRHWKPRLLQQVLHLKYSQSFLAWFPQSWHLLLPPSDSSLLIMTRIGHSVLTIVTSSFLSLGQRRKIWKSCELSQILYLLGIFLFLFFSEFSLLCC